MARRIKYTKEILNSIKRKKDERLEDIPPPDKWTFWLLWLSCYCFYLNHESIRKALSLYKYNFRKVMNLVDNFKLRAIIDESITSLRFLDTVKPQDDISSELAGF